MDRRYFLRSAGIVGVGITTAIAGCGEPGTGVGTETGDGGLVGTDGGTETPPGTETPMEDGTETGEGTGTGTPLDLERRDGKSSPGLSVSDVEVTGGDNRLTFSGVVENTGDKPFEEVELQITLLDDNDEIIGQFFHNSEEAEMQSLAPGETWNFTVEFESPDQEEITAYRIDIDSDINESISTGTGTPTETAGS